MATGSRSVLFDKIDNLENCATWPEARPKIQSILSEMAYFVINSDGAILETHEEWHSDFANRLRSDVGTQAAAAARVGPVPSRSRSPDDEPKLSSSEVLRSASRVAPKVVRPKKPKPAPSADDDIPDSLRAIMAGTHPTLKQTDDDDDIGALARFGINGSKGKGRKG